MNNESCNHGSLAPISLLRSLPINQGGSGRHHCAVCAYEEGFNLGSSERWKSYEEYCLSIKDAEVCPEGSDSSTRFLTQLHENQGGYARHKCPNCAFMMGFKVAILDFKIVSIDLKKVSPPSLPFPKKKRTFKGIKNVDFAGKELKNKRLGLLGELFILKAEKEYLIKHSRSDLAKKVEHSSVTRGDGLGYDILSFELNGDKKYIEVKTTRSSKSKPFYITRNEIEFSKIKTSSYFLYRLFDFDTNSKKGKYYIINGDLFNELSLESELYLALPK